MFAPRCSISHKACLEKAKDGIQYCLSVLFVESGRCSIDGGGVLGFIRKDWLPRVDIQCHQADRCCANVDTGELQPTPISSIRFDRSTTSIRHFPLHGVSAPAGSRIVANCNRLRYSIAFTAMKHVSSAVERPPGMPTGINLEDRHTRIVSCHRSDTRTLGLNGYEGPTFN